MRKSHEYSPSELNMRVVLRVQEYAKRHPDFVMCDLASRLMEEFNLSRATGFRVVRRAMDVLCLSYDASKARKSKLADRIADGHANARLCNWPNGKPGPRARA
jgi:hypothetical protein